MKKTRSLEPVRTNKSLLGEVVGYLMVTAVAIRGLAGYPDVRWPMAGLLVAFVVLLVVERPLRQTSWGRSLFLLGQIAIMVGLFLLTPEGDFWAIILLPACAYVVRHYRPVVAWAWIAVFIIAMSVMMIWGQGFVDALQFIFIYVAGYLLIGSYAQLLQQTEAAREESDRLLQQLQQSNAQLEEYIAQVEELTAIKERNRLARELHDAVTQSIFSMTLITRSALILQERDPGQVKGKLLQLQELAQDALQEMRDLIYQLRALSIEEDGLYPVLQTYVGRVNGQGELRIMLDEGPETLPLTPAQQQELFRIIQEAVNNIVKHAQARNAAIRFSLTDAAVTVAVSDDGVGFDPGQLNNDGTHVGLDSMRERANELGGMLEVNASPGAGTVVKVVVPLTAQRMTNV